MKGFAICLLLKTSPNIIGSVMSRSSKDFMFIIIPPDKKYRCILFPNISNLDQAKPTKMKHEAYQLKFEEGLASIITYLNDKQGKDFPYMIDPHKIFVNIKNIPDGTKKEASNYYLSQLIYFLT